MYSEFIITISKINQYEELGDRHHGFTTAMAK